MEIRKKFSHFIKAYDYKITMHSDAPDFVIEENTLGKACIFYKEIGRIIEILEKVKEIHGSTNTEGDA